MGKAEILTLVFLISFVGGIIWYVRKQEKKNDTSSSGGGFGGGNGIEKPKDQPQK
jgi:hypothetical protein